MGVKGNNRMNIELVVVSSGQDFVLKLKQPKPLIRPLAHFIIHSITRDIYFLLGIDRYYVLEFNIVKSCSYNKH